MWFNLSLMVRFVEPVVANSTRHGKNSWPCFPPDKRLGPCPPSLDARGSDQPPWWRPRTRFSSVSRRLPWSNGWRPQATPSNRSSARLEAVQALRGTQIETSLAVLSIATFQMLIMLVMLIMAGRFERQHSQVLSMHHEMANREKTRFAFLGMDVVCQRHTGFAVGTAGRRRRRLVSGADAERLGTHHAVDTGRLAKGVERGFLDPPVHGRCDELLDYAGMTLVVAVTAGLCGGLVFGLPTSTGPKEGGGCPGFVVHAPCQCRP
ncbi:MAG: hypothetical protein CM15mP78_04250 [Candidatus Poseidoniales archaeon]|nr:MAG: hypothetical protein CM15mP78_04250 [Candidatus Poseidoniales archaeon]